MWSIFSNYHPINAPVLEYGAWHSQACLATIAIFPLCAAYVAPNIVDGQYWSFVVTTASCTIVSPLAFPYFNVRHPEYSLMEKITQWIVTRLDIALKNGTIVLIIWGMLEILAFFLPAVKKIAPIYSPGYFGDAGLVTQHVLTTAALFIATVGVLLRSLIVPRLSKTVALLFPLLSYNLIGYVIDLCSSLKDRTPHLTTFALGTIIIDLIVFTFLQKSSQS